MTNAALIDKFYSAFAAHDADGMINCYSDEIVFTDPAFGELKGNDAKNMWRMLIKNSKGNLLIKYTDVTADDKSGLANWVATYTFSKTGRPVVNKIAARFEFQNGKITRHTDHFNLWKWSSQALGLPGYLLGWSPFMKNKIQKQANELLKKYNASK